MVVDAAGSTLMKRNAEPVMVEYSFGQYQRWIADIVAKHDGKVDMTTGDGAICAFGDPSKALDAARNLHEDTARFNEQNNQLELPFRLRVALHSGAVVADLNKVQFTEVIDVAAHVEKYSPIGGIALTGPFVRALPKFPDLTPSATVDGVDVFRIEASAHPTA